MKFIPPLFFFVVILSCNSPDKKYNTWNDYGGNKENNHYSSLSQIDTNNVSQLQPAWIFQTGDADTAKNSQIQCNPIIIDTVMYFTSPTLRLFAVHAGTGEKNMGVQSGFFIQE